jgi:hypothetical protein
LGSAQNLEGLHVMNGNFQNQGTLSTGDFNVYYVTSPIAVPGPGGTGADYDFVGNGWTKVNSSVLSLGKSENRKIDMTGVTARYLGVEILTIFSGSRPGMDAAVVTIVPEPASLASGLLGLALIAVRRRR